VININPPSVNMLPTIGKLPALPFLSPTPYLLDQKCVIPLVTLLLKIKNLLLAFGFRRQTFVLGIKQNVKGSLNRRVIPLTGPLTKRVGGRHTFSQWQNTVPFLPQNLDHSIVLLLLLVPSLNGPSNLVFLTRHGLCGHKIVEDPGLVLADTLQ